MAVDGLTDGSHLFTATATAPDKTIASATAAKAVLIDTHAPLAPTFTGIAGGGASVNGVMSTNHGQVIMQGSAEAGATVQVFRNNQVFGTTKADASGVWTLDVRSTSLTGDTSVYAKATDMAGNVSSASGWGVIHVDTVAPGLAFKGVAATASGVTITGETEALATISFSEDGVLAAKATGGTNGLWSASLATTGVHTYTLTATDQAGNITKFGHNLEVGTAAADLIVVKAAGDDVFSGAGADTIRMAAGTISGTVFMDFTPNQDRMQITGYDPKHSAVTRVDGTHWQVSDGVHAEVFVISSGSALHSNDWTFG